MSGIVIPPFHGNISFNAQHAPMGAFMSFTCGQFGAGGGIGVEIGKPANQNIFIGVKNGARRSGGRVRCLPFAKGNPKANAAANYDVEHAAPIRDHCDTYTPDQIHRHFGWATDAWATEDFVFTIHTPFGRIGQPGQDDPVLVRDSLLPAVIATLTVDNRRGTDAKTAFFALDFPESGTRLLPPSDGSDSLRKRMGVGWRRNIGFLGELLDQNLHPAPGLEQFQRWSLADGIANANPIHELGSCGGLLFEVPPGASRTLVLAFGAYLDGVVTTGLESRYYYTRYYSGLEQVLHSALDRADELRLTAAMLDAELTGSGLSPDQQFQIAHGTRGYYGSTQLLDHGGEPFFVVNEGEYCMMNTLDLSVDHVFWELDRNPWVVRNILDRFVRHYSYHDEVKSPGGELLPGGIAFTHDMGVHNNFSRSGSSSYELAHLNGCFSFMSQEELCNWILTAACYVTHSGDLNWLRENAHVLRACAESMRNRANPRTGVMAYDSARCVEGQEITTYDSLDESLGQARANTYLAGKCWACWIGLSVLSRLSLSGGGASIVNDNDSLADSLVRFLVGSVGADGTLPAVTEKDNPGYQSRILPAAEALVYPKYWQDCLRERGVEDPECIDILRQSLSGQLCSVLKRHVVNLLKDPQHRNLFPDGGIKLSSTSNNSWMSKIALFMYIARNILRLHEGDSQIAMIFKDADAAHVKWQTDGSGYWACSDQFINGIAKGSRYYPRIVISALWMQEAGKSVDGKSRTVQVNVFAKGAGTQSTLPK